MKKIIVCLLIICMVFAAFPVSVVSAETSGPVKGENFVLDGVTYEYLGESSSEAISFSVSDESAWKYQGEDAYWLWNKDAQTLTLHNVATLGINIWDAWLSNAPVTILVEGQAAIATDLLNPSEAIYCDGDLIITGEGNLVIAQIAITTETVYANTIYASNLTISGVKVTIASMLCDGGSINASDINIIDNAELNYALISEHYTCFLNCNNLFIKDSKVTCGLISGITGEFFYSDGFEVFNNATIENSIVNMELYVPSAEVYGIFVYEGELTINKGSAIIINSESLYSYNITAPVISIDDSYIKSNGGTIHSYGMENHIETSDEFISFWEQFPEISLMKGVILSDNTYIDPKTYESTLEVDNGISIMCSDEQALDVLIVPRTYEDVDGGDWFASATGFVTARGLFKGVSDTEFDPNGKFTRGQMMMLLARMAGADTTPPEGEPWYEGARLWAMEAGVSDGTNPEDYITREQLVTMLWNFLGKPGEILGELGDIVLLFDDADKIEPWAENAISWAVLNQVVSGKGDNKFDPDGTATRAEASQLMMNFFLNYINM